MVRGRCPYAQVHVDRVRVQETPVIPVFRLQPAPPASSTRVQEQERRRSVLLGSRTVARVIGTRPVKAYGGLNLGVVGGSLN